MASTTAKGFHAPIGADPQEPATAISRLADPTDVAILAEQINDRGAEYDEGLGASLPTAGATQKGKLYRETDSGEIHLGGAADWLPLHNGWQGLAAARPASMPRNLMTYYATDTGDLSTWGDGAWRVQTTAFLTIGAAVGSTSLVSGGPTQLDLDGSFGTNTLPGFFTAATVGAGSVVRPAAAGMYRVTATILTTDSGGTGLVGISGTGFYGGLNPNAAFHDVKTFVGVPTSVAANGDIGITGTSDTMSGCTARVSAFSVERVSP